MIEGASYVVNYFGFNQEVPLWQDLRVRQAVMHAIDRNAIIDSLYGGAAMPANCGYVADAAGARRASTPTPTTRRRPRRCSTEAGWDKINGDKPITVLTYYSSPLVANVLAAVQAMLAQVGINIVPRAVDTPTYNGIVYAEPDYDAVPAGLSPACRTAPTRATSTSASTRSKSRRPAPTSCASSMPEVTAALDAALAETDDAKRDARYQDVCKATNANLPWATMWVANRYGVASSSLQDFVWTPAPAGGPFEAHPEKWAIDRSRRHRDRRMSRIPDGAPSLHALSRYPSGGGRPRPTHAPHTGADPCSDTPCDA